MKKTISILILISIVIAVVVFTIKTRVAEAPTPRDQAIQNDEARYAKTIDVKHQYKDGEHIFAGKIEVPTPCYFASAEILRREKGVAELKIETKDSGEICAQVISEANFFVKFKGEKDQQFMATLNGEPVNLNRFEVDADQDINSVDIFIKG